MKKKPFCWGVGRYSEGGKLKQVFAYHMEREKAIHAAGLERLKSGNQMIGVFPANLKPIGPPSFARAEI